MQEVRGEIVGIDDEGVQFVKFEKPVKRGNGRARTGVALVPGINAIRGAKVGDRVRLERGGAPGSRWMPNGLAIAQKGDHPEEADEDLLGDSALSDGSDVDGANQGDNSDPGDEADGDNATQAKLGEAVDGVEGKPEKA